jgi:hypothetical protein
VSPYTQLKLGVNEIPGSIVTSFILPLIQSRVKKAKSRNFRFGFFERLAATYSRRIYKTTTIGKTVFDGRVRNGIGSDHSFMATKKRDG